MISEGRGGGEATGRGEWFWYGRRSDDLEESESLLGRVAIDPGRFR